jgi:hypothetical protein
MISIGLLFIRMLCDCFKPRHSSWKPRSWYCVSRDNLDENGGGNQGLKRRPVAKS